MSLMIIKQEKCVLASNRQRQNVIFYSLISYLYGWIISLYGLYTDNLLTRSIVVLLNFVVVSIYLWTQLKSHLLFPIFFHFFFHVKIVPYKRYIIWILNYSSKFNRILFIQFFIRFHRTMKWCVSYFWNIIIMNLYTV